MIGDIEKGKFIEDRKVMCYIACIYQMSQIVRFLLNLLIFRLKISVCFYIYLLAFLDRSSTFLWFSSLYVASGTQLHISIVRYQSAMLLKDKMTLRN